MNNAVDSDFDFYVSKQAFGPKKHNTLVKKLLLNMIIMNYFIIPSSPKKGTPFSFLV